MAWSVLQSAGGQAASSTTASVTFGSNLSSGSKILCYIANNLAVSTVKDTAGNSLTQIFDVANTWNGTTGHLSVYAMDTPAGDVGATTTITVTTASASFFGVVIQEVSGLLAGVSGLIDGTAGSVTQTTLPNTSPTYTSAASNEFLVGFLGDNGLGITGPTATGYTIDANSITGSTNCDCVVGYKNSTNGSESCVYNQTGGTNNASHAVALFAIKLAAAAGPNGTVQKLATFPTPRRRPSRAVVQFIPVATFNTGHGAAGTVQPLAVPAAAPRRRPSRAVVQFIPVKTTNNLNPPPPPVQPPALGGGKSMLGRYMRWADL